MHLGNSKTVTELSSIGSAALAADDLFTFVDVSDTTFAPTGTNKKITSTKLASEIIALADDLSAITGPVGPKGDTGLTGAKGDKGDTGLKGDTGASGTVTVDETTIVKDPTSGILSVGVIAEANIGTDAVNTNAIINDGVTFDKIQNINANQILGRRTSGSGNVELLNLDTNLSNPISGHSSVPTSTAIQNYLNTNSNPWGTFGGNSVNAAVSTRSIDTAIATITLTAHGFVNGNNIVVTTPYPSTGTAIIPVGTYAVTKTNDNVFTIPTVSTAAIDSAGVIEIERNPNGIERATSSFYRTVSFISKNGGLYSGGYGGGESIQGPNNNATYIGEHRPLMVPLASGEKIVNIYSGGIDDPSMYLLTDAGNVYSSGYNGYGQLGVGDAVDRTTFQKITTFPFGDPVVWFSPMSGIARNAISCGAVTASGKLYMWGFGDDQSLGLGNSNNYYTPQRVVTAKFEKALVGARSAGTAFATITLTAHGLQTGDNIDVTKAFSTIIPTRTYAVTRTDADTFTIPTVSTTAAITNTTSPALPNSIDYTALTTNISFRKVFTHAHHNFSYAIDNNNKVYSCGYNNVGQLGHGDAIRRNLFTLVPGRLADDILLSHGDYRSSAYIIRSGEIWSCGYNAYGQLGRGDKLDKSTFGQINLGNGNTCAQLSLGGWNGTNVICRQTNGAVKTWGYNANGQLGTNNTTDQIAPETPIGFTGTALKVETHDNYTVTAILKSDGTIWTTGYNGYGQCGRGDNETKKSFGQIIMDGNLSFKDISLFGYNSGTVLVAVDQNDNLWGAGYAGDYMLGLDLTNSTILRKISIV